jgi:3-phosphoshikimate 1-carboxyvinyltransferase
MALPDLIEIVPLTSPVRAEITVPGSKSITNRALILAALADGETKLRGALWSEDTEVMIKALKKLGFKIKIEQDLKEFLNRIITVKGLGGKIPKGGVNKIREINVGNAGTAARFLSAFVCLRKGVYHLSGVARMHERPQAALFKALRELGYRIESEFQNDKLPVKIFGEGSRQGRCTVSIEKSSQFASALMLCAKAGEWGVEVVGENAEESPYVAMTRNLVETFPAKGGHFRIEPDASSGSYFWAIGSIFPLPHGSSGNISIYDLERSLKRKIAGSKHFSVRVMSWPDSNLQIDQEFPRFLPDPPNFTLKETISRLTDLGDSIMTAITIAPLADQKIKFTDLGRLRVQECERVVALRTELTKCGAKVVEEGDTLTVYPSKLEELHGAEIETYNDHRMAMCFAVLGLKVPGIKIKNPACVKKTFPNFFQKLAAQPPHGLGVEIWEIKDGKRTRKLSAEDLFAD